MRRRSDSLKANLCQAQQRDLKTIALLSHRPIVLADTVDYRTIVFCTIVLTHAVTLIKMKLGMEVWPRPRPHCVRWGQSESLPLTVQILAIYSYFIDISLHDSYIVFSVYRMQVSVTENLQVSLLTAMVAFSPKFLQCLEAAELLTLD